MSAIVSRAQSDRIVGHIETGRREGGRLLTGGTRPDDPSRARLARGWHVRPTVFVDMDTLMMVAREEIFGPVTSVFRWSTTIG